MTNHLFVKGLRFQRNLEGVWEVSEVVTNQGKFQLGEQENILLDKDVVERFCSYVAQTLKTELEDFLEEEAKAGEAKESK